MKHILVIFVVLISQSSMALADVFTGVTERQPICYGREYGLSHLKSAPKQMVQKIQAKLETLKKYNQNILSLEVTLKGSKNEYTNYRASFTCQADNSCYIDCDGGSVKLTLGDHGKLMLINNGFVLKGGCGELGKAVFLDAVAGGDDKFEMAKLPADMCQTTEDRSL